MGLGLAELIIIFAIFVVLTIVFGFFRRMGGGDGRKRKVKSHDKLSIVDWSVLDDGEFRSTLPKQKISAIKRYRELTGADLKEAKTAVEYMIAHPQLADQYKSGVQQSQTRLSADTGGAGIQDLLAEGRFEEAADVYAAFMGVDKFTARNVITQMANENDSSKLFDNLSGSSGV